MLIKGGITMSFEKEIKRCLACPFANQIISDYYIFYQEYKIYDLEIKNGKRKKDKKLPEEITLPACNIYTALQVKGSPEEKIKYLISLANDKLKDEYILDGLEDNGATTACVFTLHKIFANLKIIFEGKLEDIEILNKQNENVINIVNSFLKEQGIIKREFNLYYDEKLNQEGYKAKWNDYNKIVCAYTSASPKNLKFKYINPLLIKYVSDKDIHCEELINCEPQLFLDNLENYCPNTFIAYRINSLNETYLEIIQKFMFDVPKKLTYTLSCLKILQNLSYKEIGELLWNKKEITARPIQSYCENENRNVPDEEIKRLAKILLVSEDVLRKGYGKIYADWDEILGQQETLKILNEILKEENKTEQSTSKTDKIRLLLNQSEENLDKIIKPHEEDINLYLRKFSEEELKDEYVTTENIDEHLKYYYDYEKILQTAKHPEEIYVLISVLEELQAKGNN